MYKILIRGMLLVGISASIVGFVSNHQVYAVPTPDSCFAFDSGSGTITDYYDHEANDPGNPSCTRDVEIPAAIGGAAVTDIGNFAFQNNQLTSVTIPDSVTTISGYGAFQTNLLTSVTIPDSVTTVGYNSFARNKISSVIIPDSVTDLRGGAFSDNQLTSVTIPDSVTVINDTTFVFNRLTEVNLPSSLQSLDVTAFAAQNQWGGAVEYLSDPAHDLYGGDLSVVQNIYDNMWYARLYTNDGSNPESLQDGILSEWWWPGDVNQNGNLRDPVGGHLINPASVTIHYEDEDGNELQAPSEYTGTRSTDDSYLTNYSITASGVVAPLDPKSPTPQESDELTAGFDQYYRTGQTKTFTAPDIADYKTPSAKTVTFTPGENVITFIYQNENVSPTLRVNGDKAITKTPTIPSRPTFSGKATPGAVVVVTVHSDPVTCTTTADSDGNWTCTLPATLSAGQHTVYVTVTNPDNSVENLGPYAVVVRAGRTTLLAPNAGVAPLEHDNASWSLIAGLTLGVLSSVSLFFTNAWLHQIERKHDCASNR